MGSPSCHRGPTPVAGVPPSPCVPNCACVPRDSVWHPLADRGTSSHACQSLPTPFRWQTWESWHTWTKVVPCRTLVRPDKVFTLNKALIVRQVGKLIPSGFERISDIGGGLPAGRLPGALRTRLRCMQLDPRRKESKKTDHWHATAEPFREGSDTSFLGAAVTAILSGVGVPQRQPAFRRSEDAGSGAPLPGRSQARSWSTRYRACR